MNEQPPVQAQPVDILMDLLSLYEPTALPDEAVYRSTQEIIQLVYQHSGIEVSRSDVFRTLKQHGFKTQLVGDSEWNWLLKRKPQDY